MSIRNKYLPMYMEIADNVARYSEAVRKKVGCVIVKPDDSITIGLNGTPSGWKTNVCEHVNPNGSLTTKEEVYHAEANAVSKLAKGTGAGAGSIAFVTCAPCINCAKLLAQAGVVAVYYGEEYQGSSTKGFDFLKELNIHCMLLSVQK